VISLCALPKGRIQFSMSQMTRRCVALVLLAVTCGVLLAACGDREPEQRAAFIKFLQTRVLENRRIAVLSEEDKQATGPYADHYAIIFNFNHTVNESVSKDLRAITTKITVRSLSDLIARRDDLKSLGDDFAKFEAGFNSAVSAADAAKAQLKQPEDLKVVYDKAYNRLISAPVQILRDLLPLLKDVYTVELDLVDYVGQHKRDLKMNGAMVMTEDPKLQAEFNAKVQAIQTKAQAVMEAQRKLQALRSGL